MTLRGALFLLTMLLASTGWADTPPDRHSIRYGSALVGRLNPLGARLSTDIGYRYKLYEEAENPLWKSAHIGAGASTILTPGLARLGFYVEAEPIGVLQLRAIWEWVQFFGILGHGREFNSPEDDYSDTAIDAGEDAGLGDAAGGWHLNLEAVLRAKVGPVVIRDTFRAVYQKQQDSFGPYWYDPYYDILHANEGWYIVNDADVIALLLDERLIVGARYTMIHSFYDDVPETDDTPTHRLGPVIGWRFYKDPTMAFDEPTIILLANWWLKHPNRTGRDVDQAFPWLALVFAFKGDLLTW